MLKLEHIHVTFNPGTVNEKKALTDLNLSLQKGDFVTILGSNGAGKSTMFNTIAGTVLPDSGKVILDGVDITALPDYKRSKVIGQLFQDPLRGTAPSMTIEENMALAFRRGKNRGLSWGITKGEKAQYRDALATLELGLEDRMNARVGLLSGGQRQALTLLMATLQQPQLLLLDEHTAALDPKTAEKVLNLTRKLIKENNLTAMMVTHNMKDALQYGNRTIMLHEGKIIIDIDREMKARMTVEDLLKMFKVASGSGLANDRMLLS